MKNNKDLLKRIWALFEELHKIENDFSNVKNKLHDLWWDIKESENEFTLKDGSIEKKKKSKIGTV